MKLDVAIYGLTVNGQHINYMRILQEVSTFVCSNLKLKLNLPSVRSLIVISYIQLSPKKVFKFLGIKIVLVEVFHINEKLFLASTGLMV